MNRSDGRFALGIGVAACAACCAGPILGVLAAVGLTTIAGALWFGFTAAAVGALAAVFVVVRRRRDACAPGGAEPAAVALGRSPGR